MYGITLLSTIALHSHGLVSLPPPGPVAPAPIPVEAAAPPPVAPAVVQTPEPVTTPTTLPTPVTDLSNVQCVVVLPAPSSATFSPGPADSEGSCATYWITYPAAVSITATPETVTQYG